jgi:hypothetical protein
MVLLKLAILTCTFYLGLAVIIQAGLHLAARLKGGVMYFAGPLGWAFVFGLIWLVSFSCAWQIVAGGMRRGR